MYRKIVWVYVFVLTFLDISLKSKLSAQGKSHDVQIHDTLVEGITFQEWGGESVESSSRGRGAAEGVLLRPSTLNFGRCALAAPHTRSVTLTNAANATLHLASVAGTTPDFHASFFESKTLAPQANTTFSVVYLGRREGPVSAHLYIHTSLGVYKYPVSAVGVASEWGLWPMVGVRVPFNASVEPLLTMHNPTDQTIQISEVYSSGGWLGLQLPERGEWAPRDAWTIAPHSSRDIVRLRLQPPAAAASSNSAAHNHHPLTAYIRIKANMTGGGLVVGVEARAAPPGEYLSPVQLTLTTRGSRDPPDTFPLEVGNSLDEEVTLQSGVWAARCSSAPLTPPPPPPPPPSSSTRDSSPDTPTANGHAVNGGAPGGSSGDDGGAPHAGVHVSMTRAHLDAHQPLIHAAQLTLDYSQMWASYGSGAERTDGGGGEAWCAGWARVGRASVPYSLRLLPGTLVISPDALHFITSVVGEVKRARDVRVRNEFPVPVYIAHAYCPHELKQHFHCESLTPVVVEPGHEVAVSRLRLRTSSLNHTLHSAITLQTNLTHYSLPVLLYSGRLDLEWEWPNSEDGTLRVGAVGVSSTRRVGLKLYNRGPATLCAKRMRIDLPGAQVSLAACAHIRPALEDHACRCVEGGGTTHAWVTVVAPARAGTLRGDLHIHTAYAHTRATLDLHAYAGRLLAHDIRLPSAAPYVWSSADIVLESSMSLPMRAVNVTQPVHDPSITYLLLDEDSGGEITSGRHRVGELVYKPEYLCQPNCYTGLDMDTPDGAAWIRRGDVYHDEEDGGGVLQEDAALQLSRYAVYTNNPYTHDNLSLYLHTTQMVQIPVKVQAERYWPRLVRDEAAGSAGLAAVGATLSYRISVRNPSKSHSILIQPVLHKELYQLSGANIDTSRCQIERCVRASDAFHLTEWTSTRGHVRVWPTPPSPIQSRSPGNTTTRLPILLMSPDAELDIKIMFSPKEASILTSYLYIRNNLTILESVQVWGRGAYPSFELGGRRPGTNAPILFEVRECTEGSGTESGVIRRTVVARNTGPVPVRLRDWRLAGVPCQARGFRMHPCTPLTLEPNESRTLHIAFAPDFVLARVPCKLRVRAGAASAEFALLALVPATLLPRCAPRVHKLPFEPPLRAAGTLLAMLALALVLAAAAIDAERELRRVRQPRSHIPDRAPLDLRALARPITPTPAPRTVPPPPPPSQTTLARRRKQSRRVTATSDARSERRAFERWRSRVLRAADAADDDDSRSSEDPDLQTYPDNTDPTLVDTSEEGIHLDDEEEDEDDDERTQTEKNDGYEAEPETEDRPPDCILHDEDAISTDSATACSTSSSPAEDDTHEIHGRNSAGMEADALHERTLHVSNEAHIRVPKPRREGGDTRRARTDSDAGGKARAPRQQSRNKGARRRPERTTSPRRASPVQEVRAPPVRWGASWSSVVAAGGTTTPGPRAPLPPIGSDVRRRIEPASTTSVTTASSSSSLLTDNSLFFFNGETPVQRRADAEYAWRNTRSDYLDDSSNAYRSISSSVWGSGPETWGVSSANPSAGNGSSGASVWGVAVRPPPGFPAAPPPLARVYDPFHSLSAIWEPNVLHWNETNTPSSSTALPTNNNTPCNTNNTSLLGPDDNGHDSPI